MAQLEEAPASVGTGHTRGVVSLSAKSLTLRTAHPSRHLSPTTKATSLAYLLFERPDLDLAEKFLTDYGLRVASRDEQRLFLRGTAPAQYCYVVERAKKARFVGLAFTVAARDDLDKLSRLPGASPVEDVSWPGGGARVRLVDPAGFRVDAIFGQTPAVAIGHRHPIAFNSPDNAVRVNGTQRPPVAPPDVVKLGHVLLEVANYQAQCAWYTQHFGLIPSDICVLPDGTPVATFFRLDLGETPADHHTLALTQSFMAAHGHSSFEVVDADAVGMGQRVMQRGGWRHSWGIGRHILGSQIFDYWQDPWGDKHEHYCDGDVFTASAPADIHLVSREAMAQWGPEIPKSFTRPKLGLRSVVELVRNLYGTEDLTLRKLLTLIKLVA